MSQTFRSATIQAIQWALTKLAWCKPRVCYFTTGWFLAFVLFPAYLQKWSPQWMAKKWQWKENKRGFYSTGKKKMKFCYFELLIIDNVIFWSQLCIVCQSLTSVIYSKLSWTFKSQFSRQGDCLFIDCILIVLSLLFIYSLKCMWSNPSTENNQWNLADWHNPRSNAGPGFISVVSSFYWSLHFIM